MGNITTQETKNPSETDDETLSEQNIIIGFIVVIILYIVAHCASNYSKCNDEYVYHQLHRPIMDGYGDFMSNRELSNIKTNPTMKDYDTSRIRYNVRTSEGGGLS